MTPGSRQLVGNPPRPPTTCSLAGAATGTVDRLARVFDVLARVSPLDQLRLT